jgi:hypothetical protein
MPIDARLAAAEAFWREDQADIEAQHIEAIVALARRLNFRTKSVQALAIDRRARHLANMSDVSDAIATRALISYHFTAKRDLMGAFLDAVKIPHENGLISAESVDPPSREALVEAVRAVRAAFSRAEADLYLRTLTALDGDTWVNLDAVLAAEG